MKGGLKDKTRHLWLLTSLSHSFWNHLLIADAKQKFRYWYEIHLLKTKC